MTEQVPAPTVYSPARPLSWVGLLAILAFCFLLAFPLFFLRGIGIMDDSLYLKMGELVADGAVPYRDVWENKTPGVYYLAALIAVVGDRHWLAPRVFLFLFGLGFSLWVIAFTRRAYGPAAARWSAWVFPLSYVLAQGYSLHTDHACALFGFAGLALACGRRQSAAAWLGAGLLVGLAFLCKQYAAFYVPGLGLSLLLLAAVGHTRWRDAGARGLALGAGFAAVLLAGVAWAVWQGVWAECYDAVIANASHFATQPLNLRTAAGLWLSLPAVPLALLALLLLPASGRLRQTLRKHPHGAGLVTLVVTGLVALVPSLRVTTATGHYGAVAVAPLAVFSAAVLSSWLEGANLARPRAAAALPALLLAPYFLAVLYGDWVMVSQDRLRIDLRQMRELRAVLDARVDPAERILCLSHWHSCRLYYMSRRPPYTPYLYFAFNVDDRFSFTDAVNALFDRKVGAALVEVPDQAPPDGIRAALSEADVQRLRAGYDVVELEHGYHPLHQARTYVLIRRDGGDTRAQRSAGSAITTTPEPTGGERPADSTYH